MARNELSRPDALESFLTGQQVANLESTLFATGRLLSGSGMVSAAHYERTSVAKRRDPAAAHAEEFERDAQHLH